MQSEVRQGRLDPRDGLGQVPGIQVNPHDDSSSDTVIPELNAYLNTTLPNTITIIAAKHPAANNFSR